MIVLALTLALFSLPDPPPKGDCWIIKDREFCTPPPEPPRPRPFPR